jgi:hypothetical protein
MRTKLLVSILTAGLALSGSAFGQSWTRSTATEVNAPKAGSNVYNPNTFDQHKTQAQQRQSMNSTSTTSGSGGSPGEPAPAKSAKMNAPTPMGTNLSGNNGPANPKAMHGE